MKDVSSCSKSERREYCSMCGELDYGQSSEEEEARDICKLEHDP